MDWLTEDSIDSLKQDSAAIMKQDSHAINYVPASTRRHKVMDPIRLSIPVAAQGPSTQRGRCGKLADSQAFDHIVEKGPKLLAPKNHLRMANSVYNKEGRIDQKRPTQQMMTSFESNADSFNYTSDGF